MTRGTTGTAVRPQRHRVTPDGESGIMNDPNGWLPKPEDPIAAIRRIVYVSVETARIVAGLPTPFPEPDSDQDTTSRT